METEAENLANPFKAIVLEFGALWMDADIDGDVGSYIGVVLIGISRYTHESWVIANAEVFFKGSFLDTISNGTKELIFRDLKRVLAFGKQSYHFDFRDRSTGFCCFGLFK
jgi:hypothetical protein